MYYGGQMKYKIKLFSHVKTYSVEDENGKEYSAVELHNTNPGNTVYEVTDMETSELSKKAGEIISEIIRMNSISTRDEVRGVAYDLDMFSHSMEYNSTIEYLENKEDNDDGRNWPLIDLYSYYLDHKEEINNM